MGLRDGQQEHTHPETMTYDGLLASRKVGLVRGSQWSICRTAIENDDA